MTNGRRWSVRDQYGNEIYLTDERWEHIIDPLNHPEMAEYEGELQVTLQTGKRKQDAINPQKYRYSLSFDGLAEDNTHLVTMVLCHFVEDADSKAIPNNYVFTAYLKEIRSTI